ncbi:hypothetical protein GCM10022241_14840 [Micrococcus endophyticus]
MATERGSRTPERNTSIGMRNEWNTWITFAKTTELTVASMPWGIVYVWVNTTRRTANPRVASIQWARGEAGAAALAGALGVLLTGAPGPGGAETGLTGGCGAVRGHPCRTPRTP